MGLQGTIYEQAPQANPLGTALAGAAKTIGDASAESAKIKYAQDERLATLAMSILPTIARNPESLKMFLNHPDFARIKGATTRMGIGGIFGTDPVTGAPTVNLPPEILSLDQMVGQYAVKKSQGLATPEDTSAYETLVDYKKKSDPMNSYYTQLALRDDKDLRDKLDPKNQIEVGDKYRKAFAAERSLAEDTHEAAFMNHPKTTPPAFGIFGGGTHAKTEVDRNRYLTKSTKNLALQRALEREAKAGVRKRATEAGL